MWSAYDDRRWSALSLFISKKRASFGEVKIPCKYGEIAGRAQRMSTAKMQQICAVR
jgi:hypothetical protein